ncbi:hypothetical protein KBD75_04495 [Candidatus Woesebacteria bacterium]|nr:hypothetical protein [Candidatus Woesebacteria bacterium]
MLGDPETPSSPPVSAPSWEPVAPPPVVPPAPTYVPAKPRSSPLPILIGFLIVIVVAAGIGIAYYKNMLTTSVTPSPTSSPIALASAEPTVSPIATASASPKSSVKPTVKPTTKPVTSPTPTPVPAPTLDIRFSNPSANIKQTIDEGKGDGRVINREYTSIQIGEFDEVSSTWSPRVTVCFHFVSNENIGSGKDIKYRFTLNDKTDAEGDMGQYDKIEAGRTYDWCRDVTTDIGTHTAKLLLNPDKNLKELTYANDLARLDWKNLADQIAPNYTLMGPNNEGEAGTCLFPQYVSDNVTTYANLKIEQKVDTADWSKFEGNRYCIKGTSGSEHTYTIKITDARGNVNEQKRTFVLY